MIQPICSSAARCSKARVISVAYTGMVLIESYAEAAGHLLSKGVIDEATARAVMVAAQAEGLNITDTAIDNLVLASQPG